MKGKAPRNLAEISDQLVEHTHGDRVCIADLFDAIGGRSHGPLLTLPALIALIPLIGDIPGVSMTAAAIVMLVSLQTLVSPSHIWLPRWLLNLSFSRTKLKQAVARLRPWVRWTRWMRPRMTPLVDGINHRLIAVLTTFLGAAMFILSLAPWGVTIPALAVLLLGLGITTRNGALLLGGILLSAVVVYLLFLFRMLF